jgi:hypothetical protein
MTNISNLTTSQLHSIIAIKEQIETLQGEIESIVAGGGGGEIPIPAAAEAPTPAKRKYHMTAAHKRKLIKALARARKIRWAKAKGMARKGKRRISAAGRAAMSAAGKARWAKVKGTSATPKPAKKDWRSSPATRAKLSAAARLRWAKARAEGKTRL